jgi:hypothetical protein
MAFGGVVTLLNLILAFVVGARLLRIGLGDERRPELALSIYFLASAFLSTVCQGLVYGGLIDPRLALDERIARAVLGLGILGMAVGGAAVFLFTWQTFRRESSWARWAALVASCLALGGFGFEAVHEGFAIRPVPSVGAPRTGRRRGGEPLPDLGHLVGRKLRQPGR